MEYRKLGNSGLNVSAIGLGGNTFGWIIDEQASIDIIRNALDLGINYIDTADMYDRGRSEEFVGKAINSQRSKVIIASKFANPMGDGPNDRGGSRYYIMKAVDASLKRLKTDYIDLYQMHHPEPTTPIEETLRALDDLVRAGKIRYIGCSNFPSWRLSEAFWVSKVNNLHSFITVQSRYHLFDRQIEKEVVPCCQAHNIGVIPWGPLAGGFLTGKYRKDEKAPLDGRLSDSTHRYHRMYGDLWSEEAWNKLAKLETFSNNHGHTVGELAISWLLAKPWVSTIIAGTRKLEQLKANTAAVDWKLTADEIVEVDGICP
ncbi:aldo/keto reductase [Chloroflexota bacterium]